MKKMSRNTPRATCLFDFVALKCIFKEENVFFVTEAISNSFASVLLYRKKYERGKV